MTTNRNNLKKIITTMARKKYYFRATQARKENTRSSNPRGQQSVLSGIGIYMSADNRCADFDLTQPFERYIFNLLTIQIIKN